jgi:hypothetical protein
MAVSMSFFTSRTQAPSIQNLVKFYMDELNQHVFADDRQVACLEAELWKGSNETSDELYIKVERLADYKRRFDITFRLEQEFDMWPGLRLNHENDDLDLHSFAEILDPSALERLQKFEETRRQHGLLGLDGFNRIGRDNRPGLRRKGAIGKSIKLRSGASAPVYN